MGLYTNKHNRRGTIRFHGDSPAPGASFHPAPPAPGLGARQCHGGGQRGAALAGAGWGYNNIICIICI